MSYLTQGQCSERLRMKFVPADDESPSERLVELDYAELASQLERVSPDGDAYDVLRAIFLKLQEEQRDRHGPPH